MRRLIFALVTLCIATMASAQTPAFDPRAWRGQHIGPPTQVLTLGSAHLNQMKTVVTPEMLVPLIEKLAAFKPDIITHEGISGEQCDQLRHYKARYPKMWNTYCHGTEDGEFATGLSVSEATTEVARILATWPTSPSAAQRRRLAAVFIAGGDRPSAQVQWLQLPESERKAGDGINAALLKILARDSVKPNEIFEIAVPLAVKLGLQRVYAVDDHTADSIQGAAGEGFDAALEKIWSQPDSPTFAAYNAEEKKVEQSGDMLAFYRTMNAPATQQLFVSSDYGVALKQDTPQRFGRQYVAWWEVRNLRMVANIRETFGNKPGSRVLNIVGASHKPYYDAYLDMMSDVKLVDVESVLK